MCKQFIANLAVNLSDRRIDILIFYYRKLWESDLKEWLVFEEASWLLLPHGLSFLYTVAWTRDFVLWFTGNYIIGITTLNNISHELLGSHYCERGAANGNSSFITYFPKKIFSGKENRRSNIRCNICNIIWWRFAGKFFNFCKFSIKQMTW